MGRRFFLCGCDRVQVIRSAFILWVRRVWGVVCPLYRLLFLRWVFYKVGTVSGRFWACEGVPRGGYTRGAHGGR